MTKKVGDTMILKLQEFMDEAVRRDIQEQIEKLEALVAESEAQVAASETQIADFRKEFGVFLPSQYAQLAQETQNSIVREMELQIAEQTGVEQNIAELTAQLSEYQPYVDVVTEGTKVSTADRSSQRIEAELVDLRRERTSLLVKYSATAPESQSINEQIKTVEQELAKAKQAEAANETTRSTLTRDWDPRYATLFDRKLDREADLALIKAKIRGLQSAAGKMRDSQLLAIEADEALKRMNRQLQLELGDLNSLKEKRSSFVTMTKQDQIYKGMQVIQWTSVKNPNQADRPNKMLAAILAIFIGLFIALVLPVAYDYLNQTLLSSRQVAAIPGLRVAAIVPRMSTSTMTKSVSA